MPKTIWKYGLDVVDTQLVTMPIGAQLLCVQTQRGLPYLWAVVDPAEPTEERRIEIRGTGHSLTGMEGNYLDTFQWHDGQLVFHVFAGD